MTEQELAEFLKQRLTVSVNVAEVRRHPHRDGHWREITVELRLDNWPISTSTQTLPSCECEGRD